MKKVILMIFALCLLAALVGCSNNAPAESPVNTLTPVSTDTSGVTTAPDFGNTDFCGHWAVSEVYDSAGEQVTGSAFEALNTGFVLEILTDGLYFVYDAEGAALGQGAYAISGDLLTLTAGGAQTVYTIIDENTLRAAAPDGSVTVMARQAEKTPEDVTEPDDEPDNEDGQEPDDAETDILEDDTEPTESGVTEGP